MKINTIKMPYISNAERFGMEKGTLEVAKHLLEEGVEPTIIAKATGFSSAKIKKLQRELNQAAN